MATASSVSEERDSYEKQISGLKIGIEMRIRVLIECLREKEKKLVNELDQMLNTFSKARDIHKQTITDLELSLKFIHETIKAKSPKEIEDFFTKQIESERKAFSSEFSGKRISIELDKSVLGLAQNLGRVVVTECSAEVSIQAVVDYKGRMTPVLSVGGRESGEEGLFDCPRGVAVEYKTGNIYVADFGNNRVQVFESNGKYLYKFGDKMSHPCYITIHQDRVAFPATQAQIDDQVDQKLRHGICRPSNSPWSSPIILVTKKDGGTRFVVDYRALNGLTRKDAYPMPNPRDTLDSLYGDRYYSSLDCGSAY